MVELVWLIPTLPLLGVLLSLLFGWGYRFPNKVVGWIASVMVGLSFLVSLAVFAGLRALPPGEQVFIQHLYTWIAAGDFVVDASLLVDPLSTLMILVVSGVGFVIHVYSIGYMEHDESVPRYFAYLNLFVFSMLTLVLASNFLLLYVGWELVGLCSYLLIGFWYARPSAANAGKKAFIVNRIGDFGFALGVMFIFTVFGTLDYAQVFERAPEALAGLTVSPLGITISAATAITLLLFLGATGKSAQLPLYVWLPDAMEGPTPVSALIHAATMVTAGVYMVARTHVLFELAPFTQSLVAWVGGLTALFAASIAVTHFDIKRVLAYSTISQLGYMFMGVGVAAYAAGIFHLFTHAFFKALLFLGAGSVMHAMEHGFHETGADPEARDGIPPAQDMRNMGGLYPKIRTTALTFIAGALALSGFPLTSGFFSKDEILAEALGRGYVLLWMVGLFTALLTAFYTFRQVFLVFSGEPRSAGAKGAQESLPVMTGPLIVLAVLALLAGLIFGLPMERGWVDSFLAPVFETAAATTEAGGGPSVLLLAVISSIVVLIGIGLAYLTYVIKVINAEEAAEQLETLYLLSVNKFYVEDLYNRIIVTPFVRLSGWLWYTFDDGVIDAAVNGVGRLVHWAGAGLRRVQTGYVRNYALSFLLGVVIIMAWFALR
ncbi:MAG: NADH-quinone oxidoreductase subunit L [Anaerolineae bacterium]